MAQLILGVNNALYGCPRGADADRQPVGHADGSPPAAAATARSSPARRRATSSSTSRLLANPVILGLVGSITVACDVPAAAVAGHLHVRGRRRSIPIRIPGIGTVCIARTAEPCPSAVASSATAATPLGVDLRSSGNVGACDGNGACAAECATSCAGNGAMASTSGCTGFCSLANDVECSVDADCLPDNGACNGPDPVGANADICQCNCINPASGPAAVAGDLQCPLGVHITVETNPPCDGSDVLIDLGNSCITQTTRQASTLITDANFAVRHRARQRHARRRARRADRMRRR